MTTVVEQGSRRWLIMISAVLLLAFAGVAWIQSSSIELLRGSVQYKGGSIVWSFFQLETEYVRLREALRRLYLEPGSTSFEQVQLRYEVFVSRINTVSVRESDAIGKLGEPGRQVMQQLDAVVVKLDKVLASEVEKLPSAADLRQVLTLLDPLAQSLHDLSLQAQQDEAMMIGARNDAVEHQYRIGLGVTIFQGLLTLVFAVIVIRQLGALDQRRRNLEELTEHLRQAQRQAEAASDAKSAFLANMSHELRTPFNGLLGMLSLLQSTPLTPTQATQLRTARESGEHLLTILNDVLDISRLESGRLDLDAQDIDLHQLVQETEALMRVQAYAKGLELQVYLAEAVPRWVHADAKRIKQILYNLLGNAIKFCDQGCVTLSVELTPESGTAAPGQAAVRFNITDTGPGMDEATQARLFQRFSQGDATITRRYGGTGLGLEISRNLARLMDGDIHVRSTPGRGSCFMVDLLMQVVESATGASASAPMPSTDLLAPLPAASGSAEQVLPAVSAAAAPVRRLRILVVDDHPVNRILMEALLGQLGHEVLLAENGAEAVEQVGREPLDLILMDIHMPVMDGLTAARTIRALAGPAGQVPIFALTADAFSESRDRVLAAGMNDFLAKPVQLDDVQQMLRQHFGPARFAVPAPPVPDSAAVIELADDPPSSATRPRRVRRFHSGDLHRLLDMEVIGEICIAVGPTGYRELLTGFMADQSGTLRELFELLDRDHAKRTPDELKQVAFKLRGVAASLGLRKVASMARELELAADELTDPVRCAAVVEQIKADLALACELCQRLGFVG
ncbi:MAG: hypothetical protein RLY71_997 [Pseudomonadota bacterium]|jgi:signal transduction histidine kinase/ActR/RegA family two-component response regulator/HPt (histidine-containing phosphotransfer) domain-containing protein